MSYVSYLNSEGQKRWEKLALNFEAQAQSWKHAFILAFTVAVIEAAGIIVMMAK